MRASKIAKYIMQRILNKECFLHPSQGIKQSVGGKSTLKIVFCDGCM